MVPIAIILVVALVAFAALLPAMIRDSRRPMKPAVRRPLVVYDYRRQPVTTIVHARPLTAAADEGTPPELAPHVTRRRVAFVALTFALLSVWSSWALRARTARR